MRFKEGVPAVKIGSFSGKIKVEGEDKPKLRFVASVLLRKGQPGCYVRFYSTGTKGTKFYRDGYTDITGKFKYALA